MSQSVLSLVWQWTVGSMAFGCNAVGTRLIGMALRVGLLVVLLIMICEGPWFYLREGWVGYHPTKGRTDCEHVNTMLGELNTAIRVDNNCKLTNKDADVTGLYGHSGNIPISLWGDLGFTGGQGFSLALVVISLLVSFGLIVTIVKPSLMDEQSLVIRLVPPTIVGVMMLLVFSIQVFFTNCGGYPAKTLANYDADITKLVEEKLLLEVTSDDRVVECYVSGYVITSGLSMLVAVMYLTDAHTIYFKLDGAPERVKQKLVEGEFGKGRDSTPSWDEGSHTTDQLHENGAPSSEEVVIVAAAPLDPNAPKDIVIEGVKFAKVEILSKGKFHKGNKLAEDKANRQSMKKNKGGQDSDGNRKAVVFEYINKHGGWVVDPADKKKYLKIKPGEL